MKPRYDITRRDEVEWIVMYDKAAEFHCIDDSRGTDGFHKVLKSLPQNVTNIMKYDEIEAVLSTSEIAERFARTIWRKRDKPKPISNAEIMPDVTQPRGALLPKMPLPPHLRKAQ